MLSDEILDHEALYRSVPSRPSHWVIGEGCPTSAVFKDKRGVSVDRDGGREEQAIIQSFVDRKGAEAGLIAVTARQCRDCNTNPFSKPLDENPYHAEIHNIGSKVELSRGKAKALADRSRIVRTPRFE